MKVVDFGIAHVEGPEATRLTRAGAMLGTPAYMAPEQLLGATVDARADIYAFGIVLSEMLTGRHPLQGRGATATCISPARSPTIIARCLHADPDGALRERARAVAAFGVRAAEGGHGVSRRTRVSGADLMRPAPLLVGVSPGGRRRSSTG